MTKQELDQIESKLRERLNFALKVHANTKQLEEELEIIKLAKIGLSAMLD